MCLFFIYYLFIIFIEYALLKQVKIAQEGNVAELKNRLKPKLADCSIDLSRNMLYRRIIYCP